MKTVLIIEDDLDIRDSCAEILELSGYKTLKAVNGKIGLDLAVNHTPDIILCDISMPELDGFGVLHLLRKNDATSEIPFIFLTARSERIDFRKAMEMGADDYLTKPFDDMELIGAIESRIDKLQRQKKRYNTTLNNLENLSLGNGTGMKELKALIAERRVKHIKKRQALFYEGDHPQGLYLLIEGSIKMIKRALDGRQLITGIYKQDDYIGMDSLLLEEVYTETAEATENAAVCLLPKDMVINLLNKYPEISRQFIKILSKDIHQKEEQLLELAYLSVRKRIAQVLVRLSYQSSTSHLLNVSRDELAELAGVALETVSRTLSDFKEEGLIEKNGNQIELIDLTRISKLKN